MVVVFEWEYILYYNGFFILYSSDRLFLTQYFL